MVQPCTSILKLTQKKPKHKKTQLINLCDSDEYEISEPDQSLNSVTNPDLSSSFVIMEKMLADDLMNFL